jgi:hypothetical protein
MGREQHPCANTRFSPLVAFGDDRSAIFELASILSMPQIIAQLGQPNAPMGAKRSAEVG